MILHDLDKGLGIAVVAPHGDLIQRLLRLIPEEHVEYTIYFWAGDSPWVPC